MAVALHVSEAGCLLAGWAFGKVPACSSGEAYESRVQGALYHRFEEIGIYVERDQAGFYPDFTYCRFMAVRQEPRPEAIRNKRDEGCGSEQEAMTLRRAEVMCRTGSEL